MESPGQGIKRKRDKCSDICAVKFCSSNSNCEGISLFRFPKDPERCKQWILNCGCAHLYVMRLRLYSSMYRVCNKHFEGKFIKNINSKIPKLTNDAIPTLNIGKEHVGILDTIGNDHTYTSSLAPDTVPMEERDQPNTSLNLAYEEDVDTSIRETVTTQTCHTLSSHSSQKDKLHKKIRSLQARNVILENKIARNATKSCITANATLKDFKFLCDKFLPAGCAEFVKTQAEVHNKGSWQRRYSREFLHMCLKIFFMGPKAYRHLSSIFTLPSKRTLHRLTENNKFLPGLNDSVFNSLKLKVASFKEIDKNCCLCLDEMALKSHLFYNIGQDEVVGLVDLGNGKLFQPALHALILMIKGIYSNWKQPLSYYFVHNTCASHDVLKIINLTINRLDSIGLNVRILINDLGSSNVGVSNLLNITPEYPIFTSGGKEVVYMFDTVHLIKATRNMLMLNVFCFNNEHTSWDHIVSFYNKDKIKINRLASKLTDAHVHPSPPERMKVYLATQVLSATVAAAMGTYISLKELPQEALATVECIERFDRLFDILNSIKTKNAKQFNMAFKGLDYQIDFLHEMSKFLENLRIYNKKGTEITHRVKCIRGWRISINAVIHVWFQTLKPCGFDFLLTRRLCQDALENLIGTIRQQGGNSVNPTCIQFQRAFRKLFTISIFNCSGSANCSPDGEQVLMLEISNVSRYDEDDSDPRASQNLIFINNPDYQLHNIDNAEKNSLRYICGYLIQKCLSIHNCDICKNYATEHLDLDETSYYSHYRAYSNKNADTFGNLCMPNDNFVNYICQLEKIFVDHFKKLVLLKNCLTQFVLLYSSVSFQHPCNHFPYNYLIKLYARMRLYYCLKFINRSFKVTNSKGERINRKQIIWQHL